MKKIEVIIESVYLSRLLKLFNDHGVTAYTLIRDIEGNGGHGLKSADVAFKISSNDYFFTVCEEPLFLEMKEEIRAFTKRYGGKCFITDTMMIL